MTRPRTYRSEDERIQFERKHGRERAKRYRRKHRKITGMFARHLVFIDPPPAEVIAERDRALYDTPRSLATEWLGDPPPGRSALDQRGGRA